MDESCTLCGLAFRGQATAQTCPGGSSVRSGLCLLARVAATPDKSDNGAKASNK